MDVVHIPPVVLDDPLGVALVGGVDFALWGGAPLSGFLFFGGGCAASGGTWPLLWVRQPPGPRPGVPAWVPQNIG